MRGEPVRGKELLEGPAEPLPFRNEHAMEEGIESRLALERRLAYEFGVETSGGRRLQHGEAMILDEPRQRAGIEEVDVLGVDGERLGAQGRDVESLAVRAGEDEETAGAE